MGHMWLCTDIFANELVSSVIKKTLSPAAKRGRGTLHLLSYLCNKATSKWYLCILYVMIIKTQFSLLFILLMGALKHCWKSSEQNRDAKFEKKDSISRDTHENAIFLLGLSWHAEHFSISLSISRSAICHRHRCTTGLELSLKNVCSYNVPE